MSFLHKLILAFTLFIQNTYSNETQSHSILIELPDKYPLNELNFFQIFELESLTEHTITIRNLERQKSLFGLLEIHSFLHSVGLKHPNGDIINGTNTGFTIEQDGDFILTNTNNFIKVEVAVALVMMNRTTSPFPSGCENTGPILRMNGVEDERTEIVRVSTSKASSVRSEDCQDDDITYESRYKYLRIGDMSSQTYFDGIKDMITADRARKNGKLNDMAFFQGNESVSLFAKVKGTGIVFQTIALDYGGRAVYIPTVTYSCNVSAWNSNCTKPDFLSLGFYVVLIIISMLLMTRALLPKTINHLAVGMGTGLVIGTFIIPFIDMEMDWKAFITIFSSLVCTGLNYLITKNHPKVSHYLTSFWLCCISSLTLFFVTSLSFNLVDYQYIFLIGFAILGTILLASRSQIDIQSSIVLGGFLFMFSICFLTNGHVNNIIEQPYYLLKDFTYKYAVKRLLIGSQDVIAFCLALISVMFVLVSYNRYGNIWEKMLERERIMRARRVALGGGTLHERLLVASEQTPLITRYTETEEDEVFESPNTNREVYSRMKRSK